MCNSIELKFNQLANVWRTQIKFESSSTKIYKNTAYLEIIQMGPDVVPFMLKDLQQNGGHWFEALHLLTKQSPVVDQKYAGNIKELTQLWLNWGFSNKYLN